MGTVMRDLALSPHLRWKSCPEVNKNLTPQLLLVTGLGRRMCLFGIQHGVLSELTAVTESVRDWTGNPMGVCSMGHG